MMLFELTSPKKAIALLLIVLQGGVACWLMRLMWDHPLNGAYVIVFLLASVLAGFEMLLVERMTSGADGPLFDWGDRVTWLIFGGLGLGLLLAVGLTWVEYQDRVDTEQFEATAAAERSERANLLRDPDVARAMQQLQTRRVAPATSR